jgi:hypothetical protein
MDRLIIELKYIVLEVKLSNEFKEVNESFLESYKTQKISEIPRLEISRKLIRTFDYITAALEVCSNIFYFQNGFSKTL